ncbi:protein kinase domain-containing protein [Agromyces subbeticus]|uniref:protein kinase domain-containing protein n=1 Tax=Agromyces subbeticus TaxID=293890 RepID=UPI0009FCF00F|nr:PASTA domain-containing protein [Agromyces subbeticus]
MMDPPGLIAGRYRLGELLGTGGSASVFASVDTMTGGHVALKLLHPHLAERPSARDAFLEEARRVRRLRHPNIAGVIDVGVETAASGPVAWIALERAAGRSLSEHLGEHGALSIVEAVAVLDGVLRALEAAHEVGLVHRDVSPANVMVGRDASGVIAVDGVRLLDFGLADAAGRAAIGTDILRSEAEVNGGSRVGVIGNVDYMSPEHVRGLAVDERGDVYQAGAVLYFAVTARSPFPRPTAAATMQAHLESPPPVPSVVDSRIPREIDRIVVRALLKDAGDRFGSAAEMRAALGTIGESLNATPVTRVLGATRAPTRLPVNERTRVQPTRGVAQAGGTTGRPRAARGGGTIGAWISGGGLLVIVSAILASVAAGAPAVPIPTPPSQQQVVQSPAPSEVPPPSSEPEAPPAVARVAIPDVTLSSLADAQRALADAGLEVGELLVVESEHPGDTVLGSSPSAGASADEGSVVALTVASGFNRIPRVIGLSRAEALAALQNAGFTVAIGTTRTAAVAHGTIVGTDPVEGASLMLKTTVTLLEAEPPPRVTPSPPPPTATPPSSPEPGV